MAECYRLNTLKHKYNHNNDTDTSVIEVKVRHTFQKVQQEHPGQVGRTGLVMRNRIKVSNTLRLHTGLESI